MSAEAERLATRIQVLADEYGEALAWLDRAKTKVAEKKHELRETIKALRDCATPPPTEEPPR